MKLFKALLLLFVVSLNVFAEYELSEDPKKDFEKAMHMWKVLASQGRLVWLDRRKPYYTVEYAEKFLSQVYPEVKSSIKKDFVSLRKEESWKMRNAGSRRDLLSAKELLKLIHKYELREGVLQRSLKRMKKGVYSFKKSARNKETLQENFSFNKEEASSVLLFGLEKFRDGLRTKPSC